jgi:hypothetical protein
MIVIHSLGTAGLAALLSPDAPACPARPARSMPTGTGAGPARRHTGDRTEIGSTTPVDAAGQERAAS